MIFTVRRSYATAVLGVVIMSVFPSVRLSLTRVLCDKTKQYTADILIPHESAITLVFWYQHWLVSDALARLKFALKWPTPSKNADFDRFPLVNKHITIYSYTSSHKITVLEHASRGLSAIASYQFCVVNSVNSST